MVEAYFTEQHELIRKLAHDFAEKELTKEVLDQVEETEDPLEVVVSFPGVEGIPAGFEQTKARIEEILPCHLLVKYQFSDSV